jgi:hypothetical protein
MSIAKYAPGCLACEESSKRKVKIQPNHGTSWGDDIAWHMTNGGMNFTDAYITVKKSITGESA